MHYRNVSLQIIEDVNNYDLIVELAVLETFHRPSRHVLAFINTRRCHKGLE